MYVCDFDVVFICVLRARCLCLYVSNRCWLATALAVRLY